MSTLLSVARSASFLSAFVSSIWFAVCFTRTLVLARLFPWISHDFWDGPYGCAFVGSLVCGASIWIERGRRRGEMALYVLPRAIRACLPAKWLRSGRPSVRWAERSVYALILCDRLLTCIRQAHVHTFAFDAPHCGRSSARHSTRSIPMDASVRHERPQCGLLAAEASRHQCSAHPCTIHQGTHTLKGGRYPGRCLILCCWIGTHHIYLAYASYHIPSGQALHRCSV